MKIALYSDLHLERSAWQPPPLDVEVVILAGDIHSHMQGMEWAAHAFLEKSTPPTVLYVAGNHEFYDAEIGALSQTLRHSASQYGIKLLENESVQIGEIRFLGTTLWSDFGLYESESWTTRSIALAATALSDYSSIRMSDRLLAPRDTIEMHARAASWLANELAQPFDGKTVVITHFAPHRRCVAPQYDGDPLTPYFVVNMAPLMREHKIDLWTFGHTHHNVDFVAENSCRVVSNQRGYPSEQRHVANGFRPRLVIEV